jgi:hypothetical protein
VASRIIFDVGGETTRELERSDLNTVDDPAYYEEDEVEPIDVTQRDINITHSQDNGGPRDNLNLTYSLANLPLTTILLSINLQKSLAPLTSFLL